MVIYIDTLKEYLDYYIKPGFIELKKNFIEAIHPLKKQEARKKTVSLKYFLESAFKLNFILPMVIWDFGTIC